MSPIPERDNPNRGDGESDEISSMEVPQVIIAAGSSEDEEDEFENFQGYQPLPQEPDAEMEPVPQHDAIDGDSSSGATASAGVMETNVNIDNVLMHTMDNQAFENAPGGNIFDVAGDAQEDEVNKLWNAPRPQETKSLSIDEDQAEKIKAAMSGFAIPKTSHPNWANILPENEWKLQVLQKIRTDKIKPEKPVEENEVLFEANFDEPVASGSGSSNEQNWSGT